MTGTRVARFGPLIVLIALGAITLGLLLLSPPSAHNASDASDETNPRLVTAVGAWARVDPGDIELVHAGSGKSADIGYAFDAGDRFKLGLSQTMTLGSGEDVQTVQTEVKATILVELSADHPDKIFLSFEDFSVEIEADDENVELPAVSSLLDGIVVEVVWDKREGVLADSPVAAGNPQVKRMLSLLVDAFRQAHPPLPKEGVADGGTWSRTPGFEGDGIKVEGVDNYRLAKVDRAFLVQGDREMSLTHQEGDGSASSTLEARFVDGAFVDSTGSASYDHVVDGTSQSLGLRFRLAREE